ncbi:DUF2267 domain-containing protein [Streptomyces sp. NPDC058374]|uniref:DUF2267 domain-containing protein n=1 Tax=Streptomyces sp. NPDC058374 TaxID=3346466 RepID=UPI00366338C2
MRYDEFLARVRDLGEHADQAEAEEITRAVLAVIARRLTAREVGDLAAQLPDELGRAMAADEEWQAESYGVAEFLRRVAERTGARPRTAEWDASAVLTALAATVSGGELNQILTQLPSGFAPLFGKPELSD